jgi:type II secretory pathway component HofQ
MQMALFGFCWSIGVQSKNTNSVLDELQPITLNFSSIDLRQLFQILAEMRGINLILSEKIQGKTNIHMNQVPWQTVLDSVVASKNL